MIQRDLVQMGRVKCVVSGGVVFFLLSISCYALEIEAALYAVILARVAEFPPVALSPYAGCGHIREVSRSHNDAPQSVGLLWTSDQLVAETST